MKKTIISSCIICLIIAILAINTDINYETAYVPESYNEYLRYGMYGKMRMLVNYRNELHFIDLVDIYDTPELIDSDIEYLKNHAKNNISYNNYYNYFYNINELIKGAKYI